MLLQILSRSLAPSQNTTNAVIESFELSAEPYESANAAQLKREAGLRDLLADEQAVWPLSKSSTVELVNGDALLPVTA